MDRENIIIDIPMLEEGEQPKQKKRSLRAIPTAAAILFLVFSIVMHSAMAVKAVEYLKNEGSELLFSFLIPDYAVSEPMIPILPEGSDLEGETGEDRQYDFLIRNSDLSTSAEYGLALTNETSYSPDLYQLLGSDRPSAILSALDRKYGKDSPKVLIYHTHATESYADSYGTGFRTQDTEKNMVAVGEVICRVLEKAGIPAIHLTELFDGDDWSAAYDNSNSSVLKTLKKYPSIQYVFDIHRDCIGNDTDGYVRSGTTVYEKNAAQLMFVCGTDEGGSDHKDWRQNLTAALHLQSDLYTEYPSLMRPVNLRRASFYQDSAPTALILECGTCANTLDEAKRSAVVFASALADYIKGSDCGLDTAQLINTLCP